MGGGDGHDIYQGKKTLRDLSAHQMVENVLSGGTPRFSGDDAFLCELLEAQHFTHAGYHP